MRATVTCVCCRRRGTHLGRGLIAECYWRHHRRGTLELFPRTTQVRRGGPWRPTGRVGVATLHKIKKLHGLGFSPRAIGWELGIGRRQVERYLAVVREQQTPAPTSSKTPEEERNT